MNTIKSVFILFCLCLSTLGTAQSNFNVLEADMAFDCDAMVNASKGTHREKAGQKFNKAFFDALNLDGSYDYPFDSLVWISKKSPENQSFRVFSWEINIEPNHTNYYGVIQMADGTMYPLHDTFKEAESIKDEEFTTDNWLGAIYYNFMEMTESNGQKYYLLFGVNRWSRYENRKIVDVLFFTKEGLPYFGKSIFKNTEKGESDVMYHRLVFTYASDAQMTVNYNSGLGMIVYDNLIPKMSRIPGQGQTFVPDGSYVGYLWEDPFWVKVDKLATEAQESAPRPKPILDNRKGKKIFGNK